MLPEKAAGGEADSKKNNCQDQAVGKEDHGLKRPCLLHDLCQASPFCLINDMKYVSLLVY
jgi:hypothetical protein